MNVDDALLVARVAFIVVLYIFLLLLALLLRRELRVKTRSSTERAPADLLIVEPYDTGLDPGERLGLLAVSSIGRSSDNEIVLDDNFLSAEHARLSWNGKGWVLEDLGSTNGTFVNGKQVRRATPVKSGDMLEFGRVKAKLVPL